MKNMITVATAVAAVTLGTLCTGCGAKSDSAAKKEIVVTIAPLMDWTRNVLGSHADEFQLTLLQKSGVDLHSFKPSAEDVIRISRCGLFVHIGGESDEWTEGVLAQASGNGRRVLNCLDALGDLAKDEETVEGMQAEEEHDHAEGEHEEGEEGPEKDEHVWLSLRMAARLVPQIADALGALDSANAADYRANAAAYATRLRSLDERFAATVKAARRRHILVADRFPFRYLVDDYGITYNAAFVGCSAETEASFKTVAFLAAKVDELNLPCVLTLEGNDRKIAKTVVETTRGKSARILTLDSLQSAGTDDYLTAMTRNLSVLAEALN